MPLRTLAALLGALLTLTACSETSSSSAIIRVGSKSFTESYILAEIVAQIIDETGEARAERKFGLGGTGIVYTALTTGDIDVYPEYTGTIAQAILKEPTATSVEILRKRLDARALALSAPLGFDNTFALVVRGNDASSIASDGEDPLAVVDPHDIDPLDLGDPAFDGELDEVAPSDR